MAITSEWVIRPLPHQTTLIEALHKDQEQQKKFRNLLREKKRMHFDQAVLATQDGHKVRRNTWEPDMCMWWSEFGVLLHSHPYRFKDKEQNEEVTQPVAPKGYLYVCENDDALANDWEVVK